MIIGCTTCKEYELPACTDALAFINTGLDAETDYDLIIVDKFGNRERISVTTDEDGAFEADISLITKNLNPHAGAFTIRIEKDGEAVQILTETNCISVTFYNNTGETEALIDLGVTS